MLACKGYYCQSCERIRAFFHIKVGNGEDAIVIFPSKDDDALIEAAAHWEKRDLDPHIRIYHPDLGLSITFSDVCKLIGIEYDKYNT